MGNFLSMKQLLQLNHHLQLFAPPLNLKFRHGAFSPCEFFFPPPLSPSHSFSTLSFSSQSFNKTTFPSRLLTCNMNRNSDMMSPLELGKPEERSKQEKPANGIYWIILLNLGIYIADHVFQVREITALYLYHNRPAWYQFITSTFCHSNWNHLSNNLFFLYIFGKLVEEEEGNFALWLSYIITGVGANLVSWLVLPRNAVSIGASGAVFGLFVISVLVKISWDWRKILQVLILGQFVIQNVMEAAKSSVGLVGNLQNGGAQLQNVNHIAHLSGALIGVALIWLLSKLPAESTDKHSSTKGKRG